MKRVSLRLASAVLALAICFGASAHANVPVSYAPAAAAQTKVTTSAFYSSVIVIVVYVVRYATTRAYSAQTFANVDPVAQFDSTK